MSTETARSDMEHTYCPSCSHRLSSDRGARHCQTCGIALEAKGQPDITPLNLWECETCGETCSAECCPRCGTYTARIRATEDGADGDKLIFADIAVDPKRVLVNDRVHALLTIGIRLPIVDGVIVAEYKRLIDDLQPGSNLSVFGTHFDQVFEFAEKFEVSQYVLRDRNGSAHEYKLFRTTQNVVAKRVGQLRVGPVHLVFDYPTKYDKVPYDPDDDQSLSLTRQRLFPGGRYPSESKRVTAYASPVVVEVVAPPEEQPTTRHRKCEAETDSPPSRRQRQLGEYARTLVTIFLGLTIISLIGPCIR